MNASTATDARVTAKQREIRKVVFSSFLGNVIEQYDFLLYVTAAALVFGPVFFTNLDPAVAIVASYGTLAAGYIARPLGGIVFGHFGDRVGRKKVLVLSMFIMGIASTLIGLVPSAATIGSAGAIILVFLRLCQGFALGGEWGGAAIMALEHAEPKKRGVAASIMQAGAPAGTVLGTVLMGTFAALPNEAFLSWGWRIPFLLSFVLLFIGLFVRLSISESPIFLEAQKREESPMPRFPLLSVLRHPKSLLLAMFGGAAAFGLQILLASFAITYMVSLGADRQSVLYAFALATVFGIGFVIIGGKLADRFGRRPTLLVGLAGFMLSTPLAFAWFASGQMFLIFLGFLLCLAWHGLAYGPLAAFMSEQFGTTARYTGAGLGYQFATLLGAGFTPTILGAVYVATGQISAVLGVLAAMSAVSATAIILTRESKDVDISA